MERRFKKDGGITLIALIITIIIMLILVAVSVNILIKSNLIGAAEKTAHGYKTAYEQENNGAIVINGKKYASVEDYIYGPLKLKYEMQGSVIHVYLENSLYDYIKTEYPEITLAGLNPALAIELSFSDKKDVIIRVSMIKWARAYTEQELNLADEEKENALMERESATREEIQTEINNILQDMNADVGSDSFTYSEILSYRYLGEGTYIIPIAKWSKFYTEQVLDLTDEEKENALMKAENKTKEEVQTEINENMSQMREMIGRDTVTYSEMLSKYYIYKVLETEELTVDLKLPTGENTEISYIDIEDGASSIISTLAVIGDNKFVATNKKGRTDELVVKFEEGTFWILDYDTGELHEYNYEPGQTWADFFGDDNQKTMEDGGIFYTDNSYVGFSVGSLTVSIVYFYDGGDPDSVEIRNNVVKITDEFKSIIYMTFLKTEVG